MQKQNTHVHSKRPSRLIPSLLAPLLISISHSATVTLPSNIGTNNFKNAFENAVRQAGNGGTVILPRANYTTNKSIIIDRRIVLRGQGGRFQNSIRATANLNNLLFLSVNGITLQDVTFNGDKKVNSVIKNFKTTGHKYINCRAIRGKDKCIGNVTGHALSGCLIQGGEYDDSVYNIDVLNRASFRRVNVVYRTIIENAKIRGFGNTGVLLDNANDGLNYVTDMRNHLIRGCTITGPGQFAVGCTLARNIDYQNNVLTSKDDPIHIEFKSSNVDSSRNRLTTTARRNGQPLFSCISILTGDKLLGTTIQNPTPNDHANRVTDSKHYDNILLGQSFFGVWALEATDCRFIRTDHRNNNPRFEKVFLTNAAKSRSSFGGSSRSQGTKRIKVEGGLGLRKSEMFYDTNVGHIINQPN